MLINEPLATDDLGKYPDPLQTSFILKFIKHPWCGIRILDLMFLILCIFKPDCSLTPTCDAMVTVVHRLTCPDV